MPTSSAPGKVYLFGEHAVVYGEPAVPCAIERRARVAAEPRDDDRIRIEAPGLALKGVTVEYDGGNTPTVQADPERIKRAVRYITAAVEAGREAAGDAVTGLDLNVESDLPIGAGLGSSAAVSVATIDAVARACGTSLDLLEVADAGYRVEREVQGGASRADTFCSAVGGAVRVEGDDCRQLDAPELPFVVGNDGASGDTGELVAGVRELRQRHGFAADVVSAIGGLVRTGEEALAAGNLDELGQLMDVNHGLLSALGVSSPSLDAMAWAARRGGALGAKLTGAGGGGCVVALDPGDGAETALSLAPACESAFSVEMATEGVVRE